MKLTKAQRRKIYLEVAGELVISMKSRFLCMRLPGTNVKENFPEFGLFEPTPEERQGFMAWWSFKNIEARIICMLLCAEMTKTENQ